MWIILYHKELQQASTSFDSWINQETTIGGGFVFIHCYPPTRRSCHYWLALLIVVIINNGWWLHTIIIIAIITINNAIITASTHNVDTIN
jgi:hypothetical protein